MVQFQLCNMCLHQTEEINSVCTTENNYVGIQFFI